jgi:prevent-host-death family protein
MEAGVVQVDLGNAAAHLSGLVDRAAAGEEILIARNGIPVAKLVPLARQQQPRRPAGALGITFIAPDFDAADDETVGAFG